MSLLIALVVFGIILEAFVLVLCCLILAKWNRSEELISYEDTEQMETLGRNR